MDWQQITALVLVLAASFWLGRKLWASRKASCGCEGTCSAKKPFEPMNSGLKSIAGVKREA
jgi:hypothetical protein